MGIRAQHRVAGLAIEVIEWPERPRWWHYLGRELRYAGWYRSAIEELETHAAMASGWSAERSQSLCTRLFPRPSDSRMS